MHFNLNFEVKIKNLQFFNKIFKENRNSDQKTSNFLPKTQILIQIPFLFLEIDKKALKRL